MAEYPVATGTVLLLHGLMGGWDEFVILAAGVLLAVVVVKWTSRSSQEEDEGDDDILGASDGVSEKHPEQS
jgi:hypothetical protein